MASESHKSLFSGAATFYKYRSSYPKELFELIIQTFELEGSGRLLDLGCGPGNVCLGLHPHFEEVVALDINPEMLAEGRKQAGATGANITWLESPAEAIGPELGTFKLVTLGRSFHWMQRDLVMQRVWDLLEPGGGVALLGSSHNTAWWEIIVQGLVKRWRTHKRLAHPTPYEPFSDTLERAGFQNIQTGEIQTQETVRIAHILGQVYSNSSSKPELFAQNLQAFENDVRRVLLLLEPSGQLQREPSFDYVLARK